MFDDDCLMTSQVNTISKSAYFALFRISKIRNLLDRATTEKLIHAFVSSKLEYCNSLLVGIPQNQLSKLQSVQNAAAKLISRSRKYDEVSPILYDLHWLKVEFRINFKIMLFVFKILSGHAPHYLSSLIERYVPGNHSLRSGDLNIVTLVRTDKHKKTKENPRTTTKRYGWRAFFVVAPFLWNELPRSVRKSPNLVTFKSGLKTFYFKKQFNL
ncbi:hypothetical protein SNE40_001062 [Patella caerulea]